jgi:hypothetical protein
MRQELVKLLRSIIALLSSFAVIHSGYVLLFFDYWMYAIARSPDGRDARIELIATNVHLTAVSSSVFGIILIVVVCHPELVRWSRVANNAPTGDS